MWEKIVLNLLSNAFKYTLEGEIAVALRAEGDHVALAVRDSGVGIPPEELPHLLARFHPVRGARPHPRGLGHRPGPGARPRGAARRHHRRAERRRRPHDSHGDVAAGIGAPAPRADRRGAHPGLDRAGRGAYVEEALRWLPEADAAEPAVLAPRTDGAVPDGAGAPAARILLADDNADMRA
jgi:hypothetical protein